MDRLDAGAGDSRKDALQKVEVFFERARELLDPSLVESVFKLLTK
ncbi:hypothetical protein A2U01_0093035 [Trifolium medium]|uniref:Uncharacterized protein n=1 Tax=Trifolium medium TaxID=97028 RepID=A0A392UED8_9FABA|nr:hypothetical protein [Trifolium medium]